MHKQKLTGNWYITITNCNAYCHYAILTVCYYKLQATKESLDNGNMKPNKQRKGYETKALHFISKATKGYY